MEEKVYWAHLASVEGIGSAIFDQLLKRFGSIKRAFEAPLDEVLEIPGLDERTGEAICRANLTLKATQEKIKGVINRGVQIITKMEPDYPPRLREAVDPPPIIYQLGKLRPEDNKAVAIIGSRECSEVSAQRAREYAAYFAASGIAVVSGYAYGVDVEAHIGAVSNGGRTVIIPGCGIDIFDLKPFAAIDLNSLEELLKTAVVLSEQPPEADWSPRAASARNRLVAAQASAVLVIEARLNSSTLDTVARAQKLNRPIFAQGFGTITKNVMGNEMLRKEGAGVIQDVNDLDRIVELIMGSPVQKTSASDDEDLRR